jgi:hypothetical protein
MWNQLVENHLKFSQSLKEFFAKDVDRVSMIRNAMQRGELAPAFYVLKHMPTSELVQLFEELVKFSTAHGYAGTAREIILSLPREWILANIESTITPLLGEGVDDDYRRILELLFEVDRELAMKYAQKATQHQDPTIQEVGRDFIEIMDDNKFDS